MHFLVIIWNIIIFIVIGSLFSPAIKSNNFDFCGVFLFSVIILTMVLSLKSSKQE